MLRLQGCLLVGKRLQRMGYFRRRHHFVCKAEPLRHHVRVRQPVGTAGARVRKGVYRILASSGGFGARGSHAPSKVLFEQRVEQRSSMAWIHGRVSGRQGSCAAQALCTASAHHTAAVTHPAAAPRCRPQARPPSAKCVAWWPRADATSPYPLCLSRRLRSSLPTVRGSLTRGEWHSKD